MKLYHQGRLDLDEDASKYLGFSIAPPAHKEWKITIRKLLSHTSNLKDGEVYDKFLEVSYKNGSQPSLKDLFKEHENDSTALWSEETIPENYFTYCNLGYIILGTIVERITNKPFYKYVSDSIFSPYEIDAAFRPDLLNNVDNLSVLYRNGKATNDNYTVLPEKYTSYVVGINAAPSSPQGGLRISAKELSKIMKLLIKEKEIFQPQWTYNGKNGETYNGQFKSWGLGVQLLDNPMPLAGHGGDAYGLISGMFFNPETQSGIIYILNGYYNKDGFLRESDSPFYNVEKKLFEYSKKHLK